MPLTPEKAIRGLYAITDAKLIRPKRFATSVRQALEGGARIVQYRDKSNHHEQRWQQAQQVVALCKQYQAISIINDDVELAKIVDADGVHIGIDDQTVLEARQELGDNKIIGVTCYSDIQRATIAIAESADYVAFGSIFPSPTKPQAKAGSLEVIRQARQQLDKPIVAIGGITLDNIGSVIEAGADSVAVISAIFAETEADAIQQAASAFSQSFLNRH